MSSLRSASTSVKRGWSKVASTVFPLMRDSALDPAAYLDTFFDTGSERQGRTG